jgi:hypothetical protein
MESQALQIQYDKIYFYFKTTTEPYDYLEWDGLVLKVWNEDRIAETYKYKDLRSRKYGD